MIIFIDGDSPHLFQQRMNSVVEIAGSHFKKASLIKKKKLKRKRDFISLFKFHKNPKFRKCHSQLFVL
jgi:hypothetical protein